MNTENWRSQDSSCPNDIITSTSQPVASRSSVSTDAVGVECCPICGGDCASANPPIYNCPMQSAALRSAPPQQEAVPVAVKELAHKILGSHCACYAEFEPTDFSRSEVDKVADLISKFMALHPSTATLADETLRAEVFGDSIVYDAEGRVLKVVAPDGREVTPDWLAAQLRAEVETLKKERDELRAAIFGLSDYSALLRHGNFLEMARTTEDARRGAIARAEAAEAKLAALAQPSPEGRQAEEVEKLRTALKRIADQPLTKEMDEPENADFEGGYEAIVCLARAALPPESTT